MIRIPTSDEEYYRWLESNAGGYVVNADKSLKNVADPTLHKTACAHINDVSTSNFTGAQNLKICLSKRDDLKYLVQQYDGMELKICKSCAPLTPDQTQLFLMFHPC